MPLDSAALTIQVNALYAQCTLPNHRKKLDHMSYIPGHPGQNPAMQSYPGPAAPPSPPAPQGYGAPPAPQGYGAPPAPQGYAQQGAFAAGPTPDQIGAMVAGATDGYERFPDLLPGDYVVRIVNTIKADRSPLFIAEFEVVESTNPAVAIAGMRSWKQPFGGPGADALAKQSQVLLGFALKTYGIESKSAALEAGWTIEQIGGLISGAMLKGNPNNPLVGKFVRVTVVDSGKVSSKSGRALLDYNFRVA